MDVNINNASNVKIKASEPRPRSDISEAKTKAVEGRPKPLMEDHGQVQSRDHSSRRLRPKSAPSENFSRRRNTCIQNVMPT